MNAYTDITIEYDSGSFTFVDQIIIASLDGTPFCSDGDSGSLIVDRQTGSATGLLCAASDTHGIANHITHVLAALNVSLV